MRYAGEVLSNEASGSGTVVATPLGAAAALAAIGIAGLALRIIGLRWGLPYEMHPDESVILATVEGMSWSNLNPGFFNYPGFFIYQVFLLGRLVAAAGGEVAHLIYTARFLTAMYGWATIWFVYLLGVSLGGRRLGTIAAGLFAVMGAATLHAHYAVTDTPVAALATATVWLSVRSWQRGSYGGIAAAAALAGLAVSTKYSVAPVCLVPWLGAMALAARDRTPIGKRLAGTVVLAAMAVAAFFATSPYTLLDAEGFVRDMGIESRLQAEARPGLHVDPLENPSLLDRGLVINGAAMAADLGIPAFLLALLCLGLALARFGRADAGEGAVGSWGGTVGAREGAVAWGMTAAWVLLYYAFMAPSAVGGQRYMIPVYPVMMVLTAGGIEALAGRLTGRFGTTSTQRDPADGAPSSTLAPTKEKTGNLAVWTLVVLAVALPAWQAIATTRLMAWRDTRLEARDWIIENLPAGAHLAREYYAPFFHTSDGFPVSQPFSLTDHPLETDCAAGVEYLLLSSLNANRYLEGNAERFAEERAWYDRLGERTRLVERFEGMGDLELHHPAIEVRRLFCAGDSSSDIRR